MPVVSIRTALLILGSCLAVSGARADVIMLKNGGQVRGQLQTAVDAPVVVIETLLGGAVSIDQSAIENIERRSLLVEAYESRAQDVEDSVEARWRLAEWCKANNLRDQREEQLLFLLDVDPDHKEARSILGHKLHNGKWLTRDEWMTTRGYVLHDGKWVTQQERDLRLKSDGERAAETAWYPKIRQWYNWATGRNPQRAAEGRASFQAITDPDAVPALVNFLGSNNDPDVRLLCVELLARMEGPKPVEPLVRKSLFDDEHDVRIAARNAIRKDQYSLALEHYVPELRNDSNAIIQRAAVAIRDMGDLTVVPYLIQALVTHHRWKIEVPAEETASFSTGPNGEVGLNGNQTGWLPPEIQGLAATGQLPYGAIILKPTQPRSTRIVTIKGDVKNAEVLAALKKITGQDFGYNKRQWELWYQTQADS